MNKENAGFVSLDPDDAISERASLEEALRESGGDEEEEESESRVYKVDNCHYLIRNLSTLISARVHKPIGKVVTCAMALGVENFTRRFGDEFDVIEKARLLVLENGGGWEEKLFVDNFLVVDFHTSKLYDWSVRMESRVVGRADRLASMTGMRTGHLRQLCIMGGLMMSRGVRSGSKMKMVDVVKWFGGVLEEKAEKAREILKNRKGSGGGGEERIDDPWDLI